MSVPCGCQHYFWWYCQASIRDCADGEGNIERILDVFGLYTEENVSKMRADLSQLEHPHVIASPPSPSQRPVSVLDRQGVCTLC